MGLKDSKCESCKEEVGFLFPISIIQELPSGGEQMVVRYYCWNCYDTMMDAAKDEIDDTEDNDDSCGPDKDKDDVEKKIIINIIKNIEK